MIIKPLDDWNNYFERLEACLDEIGTWMSNNLLKLNQDKTKLIVFSSKHQSKNVPIFHLKVGESVINSVISVRNLGVYFDRRLTMEKQVASIVKSCNYHLCNIGRIRRFISTAACKTLVNLLVTSRLDYANSLFFGVNKCLIDRLQRVQNIAAVLSLKLEKGITLHLFSLICSGSLLNSGRNSKSLSLLTLHCKELLRSIYRNF